MKKKLFMFFVLFGSFLFFLNGGDKEPGDIIVELPELTRPFKIEVYGDEIFVVNNRFNIIVYSSEDFKLKRQFGKKGEGPGEFKYRINFSIRPDFILVDSQDRLSWFSKEGKFLKQKNKKLGSFYIPFKNKFIVESTHFSSREKGETEFEIYDPELKKSKKLYKYMVKTPLIGGPDAPPIKEWPMIRQYCEISYDITSGKIFIFDNQNGFFIKVFAENGNNLYTIHKDEEIEKIKIPDEYKDKKREEFKQEQFWLELQKPKLIFPEHFPSFRWATVNKGKIYVQTYKRKNNKTQFIVLDLKGKILKEIYLPLIDHNIQTVYNNKLYKLVENLEKETWELHIYEI